MKYIYMIISYTKRHSESMRKRKITKYSLVSIISNEILLKEDTKKVWKKEND